MAPPSDAFDSRLRYLEAVADLEVRIEGTDAEIGPLSRVAGDPGRLRQLFQNPPDNEITYSGDRTPRISVFAEYDGPRWMVSVLDRGVGIDPSETDLFRVFDRLHGREEYVGTGIELALCRRIAERHGARAREASSSAAGSRSASPGGAITVDSAPDDDLPSDD
ncbi:signal transduction histidine kinase [Natrinema mahii]|nr:signal transduction histidine kinase [Natrinema mahii]